MPKRKNSGYYAVIRAFYITVPSIFSSWYILDRRKDQRLLRILIDGIDFRGDAHPLMDGFWKPDFHGFETSAEAEDYMDGKGDALQL